MTPFATSSVRGPQILALSLVLASGCSAIRIEDVQTPRPIPEDSCLVVGFLGGRDAWDDETKGVRQLALELRRRGFFAETFENRSREVALELVREARGDRLVLYGQSFGGAAVARFARDLERLAVPVELTLQIDSVGREDGTLPPNVRNAANLFQTDGWFLEGEHPIRASDPSRTRILGNWRFDYSQPPGSEISLSDVPWWKLAFRIPHARMDRDPEVWSLARRLIEAACTGGNVTEARASRKSRRSRARRGDHRRHS
jgi:pimeloyl-ACP methyl ester carboxylesterase